ncbi:MAG: hypothetical protein JSV70_04930 [bacterium]|nr:MAG: hypothetical protein JSV70_04930 [bacterium]
MKNCETLDRMLKMSAHDRDKTGRVVARTFYKILRQNGFTHPEIIDLTGNILDEVMKDIRAKGKDAPDAAPIRELGFPPTSKEVA